MFILSYGGKAIGVYPDIKSARFAADLDSVCNDSPMGMMTEPEDVNYYVQKVNKQGVAGHEIPLDEYEARYPSQK